MTPRALAPGLVVTVSDAHRPESFNQWTKLPPIRWRRVQVVEVDGQNQQSLVTEPDPDPWVLCEALEHVLHSPRCKKVRYDTPRHARRETPFEQGLAVGDLFWVRAHNLHDVSMADEQDRLAVADAIDKALVEAEALTGDGPPVLVSQRKLAGLIRDRDLLAETVCQSQDLIAAADAEDMRGVA